jgi:hypothetical protein
VIGRILRALRHDRRFVVGAALLAGALADILAAAGAGGPARPVAVLVFLVLGPGLAVTGFVRFDDVRSELVVAVPLSLAIGVLAGTAMSFARAWDTDVALLGLTLAAVAATAVQARRRARPPAAGRAPLR